MDGKILKDCEDALELYTFEQILGDNYVDEAEALAFLVSKGFIKLPEVNMLRFEDDE